MIEVKIVDFSALCKGKGEAALTQLVNQGWRIVSVAGGGSLAWYMVVLQRELGAKQSEGTPGSETWDVDPVV
jgi:hypothetical protein